MSKMCSKLSIKHQNDYSGLVLVSFLLTFNFSVHYSNVVIVDFEHLLANRKKKISKGLKVSNHPPISATKNYGKSTMIRYSV